MAADDKTDEFVSSGPACITTTTGTEITVVIPNEAGKIIKVTVDVIDHTP